MRLKSYIVFFLLITDLTLNIHGQNLKILPLGNSLTKGVYCTNGSITPVCNQLDDPYMVGYRYHLYTLLTNSGYSFEFVGNELAGTSVFYPQFLMARHAGYPGIHTAGLATKLNENNNYLLNSTDPHVILLEIGTNDVYGGATTTAGVLSILNEIDEYELSEGKPVVVFLSKIIKFTEGTFNEAKVATFNNNLATLYNSRRSAGDLIEFIDIGASLINKLESFGGDMADQLHPAPAGYDKMAVKWFEALNNYNSAPGTTQVPNQSVNEGESFPLISLDGYVNDLETNDANITWSHDGPYEHFDISFTADRKLVITPLNGSWNGTESITIIATDNGKNGISAFSKSSAISFNCTINAINDPPVIAGQKSIPETAEESPLTILLDYINFTDPDDEPSGILVQLLSGTNYSFVNNIVTPTINFSGELTVNLRLFDGEDVSNTFGFKVMVTSVNDKPVIESANSKTINEDTRLVLKINDFQVSDPDNYFPADFSLLIEDGQNYTQSGDTVIPEADYSGNMAVNVRVKDLIDLSEIYVYNINVNEVNDKPVLVLLDTLNSIAGTYFELQVETFDPDPGDNAEVVAVVLPNWLIFDSQNHKLKGTPQNPNVGENQVKLRVTDNIISVDSIFSINVALNTSTGPNESSEKLLSISPNPVNDKIYISVNDEINFPAIFSLYSYNGIKVSEWELYENSVIEIDNSINTGVYIYSFEDKDGKIIHGKVLISKQGR